MPVWLRRWFVVHFAVDMTVAIPLFFAPQAFLAWCGWQTVDEITARIAAAALFGVGIESFLGRNAALPVFRQMLNLKIIWSFAAVAGVVWSLAGGWAGSPVAGWLVAAVFAGFHCLWVYWRLVLR